MKNILVFFFIVFTGFVVGVYSYEKQVASPSTAKASIKTEKEPHKKRAIKPEKSVPFVKKPSSSGVSIVDIMEVPSRVVDLIDEGARESKKQIEIEGSIKTSIKKSVCLDIQKAVVTEILNKP